MTIVSSSHNLAFTATQPEHCLDCFRLIRSGETYYQSEDGTVLYPSVVLGMGAPRSWARRHLVCALSGAAGRSKLPGEVFH
jgi:hypothetical protein